MISRNYQPLVVKSEIENSTNRILDVCATKSEDGKTIVLQVVNANAAEVALPLKISGFIPVTRSARVQTLSGPLDARNTAARTDAVKPSSVEWKHGLEHGETTVTFAPHSFTIIRF
jgi:alpha-L-arabinofuranosidase